ncbi:MAG: sugar transferase [Lachnospiraceae bacterium]|nr:sugar transferase [Lachnospiraceae bacterium]
MRKWEELPRLMQCDEVREYYDILCKKRFSLGIKRCFDFVAALVLLIICALPMVVISIRIAMESDGGVFYRQVRVTKYGKKFRIHKFRTMVAGADRMGTLVTVSGDGRITPTGVILRKYRLDELPQLFDVLAGNMSFVGTRPEVPKYVKEYTKEMWATLLLPAGITSEASIQYKDEAMDLGKEGEDADQVYVGRILPEKMKYNLEALRNFGLWRELGTMIRTIRIVIK